MYKLNVYVLIGPLFCGSRKSRYTKLLHSFSPHSCSLLEHSFPWACKLRRKELKFSCTFPHITFFLLLRQTFSETFSGTTRQIDPPNHGCTNKNTNYKIDKGHFNGVVNCHVFICFCFNYCSCMILNQVSGSLIVPDHASTYNSESKFMHISGRPIYSKISSTKNFNKSILHFPMPSKLRPPNCPLSLILKFQTTQWRGYRRNRPSLV